MKNNTHEWTTTIQPQTGWLDVNLKEVWKYRDLILLFVKRDIITKYKQTVLGPLWLIFTPLISTLISTFVFGTIAGIETGTVPYFMFYFCGSTAWTYFATCITSTSSTFTANASIFGKVYFPRLTMPFSAVITALVSFGVQFAMMIGFMVYFSVKGAAIQPVWNMLWMLPILLLQMALLGLGCGIILSSLTTKYRDLVSLITFGVDAWRYVTPVIYLVSSLPKKYQQVSLINPMTPIIEAFRYICLGEGGGELMVTPLLFSWGETIVILFCGIILFSRVEKTFMDTV